MDIQVNRKALSLFLQFFNTTKSIEPTIPQVVQKPMFIETEIQQPFERTTPEKVGVSSVDVEEFYKRLKNNPDLDMHGIMILKNGKVISEGSFGAYKQNIWHITHSECKSITGLAIGLLVDDKKLKLDERIIDIFSDECSGIEKITHRGIRVKDLLTMRSGISFAEIGAAVETKWIEKYFESTPSLDVGKKFNYNSMNTYMLSAIIKKVSGENMMDLLKKRIFNPLGIENIYWEKSPEGIEKGGWGLYVLREDLAKIGQLVLNKGSWKGKQLISKKWILETTKEQVNTSENMGTYSYGYQLWVGEQKNTFLFNGMFGQNLIGNFDNNLLVVINAGNDDVFQKSPVFEYYDEIFNKDKIKKEVLSENRKAYAKLKKTEESLKENPKIGNKTFIEKIIFERKRDKFFNNQIGNIWNLDKKKAATLGLLPFCVQAIQNNYTKGMESIWFETEKKKKYLVLKEKDEVYKVPFNFSNYEYTTISFHGEEYQIGISARSAQNEDGCPVLTLRLSFLEISNTRGIKITFKNENKAIIEFTENPGKKAIKKTIGSMKEFLKKMPIINSLDIPITDDFIAFFVDTFLGPKVSATKK